MRFSFSSDSTVFDTSLSAISAISLVEYPIALSDSTVLKFTAPSKSSLSKYSSASIPSLVRSIYATLFLTTLWYIVDILSSSSSSRKLFSLALGRSETMSTVLSSVAISAAEITASTISLLFESSPKVFSSVSITACSYSGLYSHIGTGLDVSVSLVSEISK